jgi:hypothetical protein
MERMRDGGDRRIRPQKEKWREKKNGTINKDDV